MKTINLFVDFEFTSLSPDAQPISVGIVSEGTFKNQNSEEFKKYVEILNSALFNPDFKVDPLEAKKIEEKIFESSKSFYAEFSDFDINRCDEWVKENVVGKLKFDQKKMTSAEINGFRSGNYSFKEDTEFIKLHLKEWLKQFSDYQITFVVDCGTWDWYHLLQLLAIWDNVGINDSSCPFCGDDGYYGMGLHEYKTGLPTLPINVSPVPMDLNDLIAHKKGISVREAFDLNREELAFGFVGNVQRMVLNEWHEQDMAFFGFPGEKSKNDKHNALFDARVMKAIYEKLIV